MILAATATVFAVAGCGNQKTVDVSRAQNPTQAVSSNPNASEAVKAQAAQQSEIAKRQQQMMQAQAKANAAGQK